MLALAFVPGAFAEDASTPAYETVIDSPNKELIDAPTAAEAMPAEELFNALISMCEQGNNEEAEAIYNSLSTEKQTELNEYMASLDEDDPLPESVVFTTAGPFFPAVDVSSVSRYRSARAVGGAENDRVKTDGVVTKKEVQQDSDGNQYLYLESYVTGETTTTTVTESIPVDIILVLDQSGSMAYDFNGDSTNANTDRRQYAMKQAVSNFIDSVAEKYTDKADHRMALVTFGSNASTLEGWTFVNESGKTNLRAKINGLPDSPSGATNVAAGMTQAETLMGTGYNYMGSNQTRQKVIVVFTDGVPTTSSEFDTTVASNAITSAKNLKDNNCTVYTVGIFNGVDPDQLYGEKWDYLYGTDIPCDGNVGSYWGGSWAASIIGRNDFEPVDIAAGNRFLNYLSSNFAGSTNIGIKRGSFNPGNIFLGEGTGYQITANFDRTDTGYYLTASDSNSLNAIFQTISDNIQSGEASVELGSETVVKDVISDYFTLPKDADAGAIEVYTSAYTKDGQWENPERSTLNATVEGNTVSVSGFDFSKNYCEEYKGTALTGRDANDPSASGDFYGRKLIIKIPIVVRSGFLGGNNVPTNGADSGIYADNETEAPIENFETPTTNVPIPDVTVTAEDKNVYLCGNLTQAQMKEGVTAKCGEIDLDLSKANYGLQPWQTAYVAITQTISDEAKNLTEDGTYTVSCTVAPSENGTYIAKTDSANGTINVFKPEVTFKDLSADYGDSAPGYDSSVKSTVWKHGTDSASEVTMIGTAPQIVFTYTPDTGSVDENKLVAVPHDYYVNATAKIGETNIDAYTTYSHQDCDGESFESDKGKFIVHVKTCALTITKSGWDSIDENQAFLFNVVGSGNSYAEKTNVTVTVYSDGTATVKGLPVGSYTVTEENDWSWRYALSSITGNGMVSLTADHPNANVQAVNNRIKTQWLNGDNFVLNRFGYNNISVVQRYGLPEDSE